jgi:putative SOS response-associated peptidase YedK
MRWGLLPPWTKTSADGAPDTKGPLLINARAEQLTSSPAYRTSAKHMRCLVPMGTPRDLLDWTHRNGPCN